MQHLPPIMMLVAAVCGVTAILDMAVNGSRHAEWAPWGIGIALTLGVPVNLLM
jgi:hypothetical protein